MSSLAFWLRHRWLAALVATLILIPVLLIGATLALLGTRTGNLWLLHRAAPYLPGELQVEGWQGSLLTGLQVGQLDYRLDDLRVSLSGLAVDLDVSDLTGGRLHLERLAADSVTITPPASTDASDDGAPLPPDSLTLPLGVRIDTLAVTHFTLQGEQPLHIDHISGRHLAAWKRFRLDQLALTVADTRIEGSFNGRLSRPYRLAGSASWRRPAAITNTAPPATAAPHATATTMAGSLKVEGTLEQLHLHHQLSAPVKVTTTGTVGLRDGTLHLDLTHRWPAQALPLATPVPLKLDGGTLTTSGTPEALKLDGQADITADGQPLHLLLQGTTSGQTLDLHNLTLSSRQQSLTLNGQLHYGDQTSTDGLSWKLAVKGQHLDPAVLAPDWPGSLSLEATSQGHWRDSHHWQLTIAPLRLDGTLKRTPLTLTGQARPDGSGATAVHLNGRWGQDRLLVNGSLGEQVKLDGTLAIADLSRWYAPVQGRETLTWKLRGPLTAPLFSGQLDAHKLAWQGWHLSRLRTRFQNLSLPNPASGTTPLKLSLQAEELRQGDATRADHLTLDLNGTPARHQATLTVARHHAHTRLTLNAGLDAQYRWRGQLRQWTLSQPQLGTWQLQQPAAFTVATTQQSLQSLCLVPTQGEGKLCLDGRHRNGAIQGHLELRRLPLALANAWLGDSLKLAGQANGDAQVQGRLDNPGGLDLNGDWNLRLNGARVTVAGLDTQQTFTLSQAELHGGAEHNRLHNRLDLVVADQGEIHAEISNGVDMDRPLSGQVSLSIPRLDDLAPLIPYISALQGGIQGRLQLSGTPAHPGASGRLALSGGQVTVPELGITADAITLSLSGDADGLSLQGQAGFGKQQLHLDGHWNPARSPLALTLHLQGEHLLVANRSDAKVYLSPDLTLNGDAQGLHLSGAVRVPEADLRPHQLPANAITVSPDQVLVDARARQSSPLPFSMAVTITLGDQVHFQGFGLNATLGGELQVTQKPGEPAQLYGDLLIKEGRYRAYGQNLAIDNGRLLFQGAADNPGLDIRAIRKIPSENQIVGVQLSGTLQQPQARIFSNPELEESQAMSYLLTGHGLNQGSQADSAQVARALALYGLQQGQGITQKIGDTLGLDEVTVGSDWGDANDAALMLGKQLSSRLYLTYAVGLFDAVSTVMLRYTLTRTLHLEAQSSSKSQAIDLIWEKELK